MDTSAATEKGSTTRSAEGSHPPARPDDMGQSALHRRRDDALGPAIPFEPMHRDRFESAARGLGALILASRDSGGKWGHIGESDVGLLGVHRFGKTDSGESAEA